MEAFELCSKNLLCVSLWSILQIELLAPPHGEGSIYEALSKDLRPSLEWSLDDGWTVPFSKVSI